MALDVQRSGNSSMPDNLRYVTSAPPRARHAPKRGHRVPAAKSSSLESLREVYLPDEIVLKIVEDVIEPDGPHWTSETNQRTLWTCSLINRQWYAIATPFLYKHPFLEGPNYDMFTRTICPSINLSVRKSPLASYVWSIDLSRLVHQGSKSTTARLLGRTKASLRTFCAPQASFSLNCFPALSKCHALTRLNLRLVSESADLKTLFNTVSQLDRLEHLFLPRSSGWGAQIDPAQIQWPPRLRVLGLSGGLDSTFWQGQFDFPDTLTDLEITHCPKLTDDSIEAFLENLSCLHPLFELPIRRLEFRNLPMLSDTGLDHVLAQLPFLQALSVSVDYVSTRLLQPFGHPPDAGMWQSSSNSGSDRDRDNDSDSDRVQRPRRRRPDMNELLDPESFGVMLEELRLTDSGDMGDPEKLQALDVLIALEDWATVPMLRYVEIDRSLGWHGDGNNPDVEALDDCLRQMHAPGPDDLDEPFGVRFCP